MNLSTIPENDHYIVAIGASAGGLEAIHEFFDNMPSNGSFSFVIIQHLSPDYKSLLVELVAKHTNMKVEEAKHGVVAEKNFVYVIPNNKLLTIEQGKLVLKEKNFEKAPNTAIDTFLRSLARDQKTKAIAIILSGTGTDGSKGIVDIHKQGGLVLVQDPLSAKFDGMPNSAINTGYADYILSPELMPEELFNHTHERPVRLVQEGKPDEALLPEVLKLVEKHCQYDFYNYKTPTILRRIGRRMGLLGYKKFNDYLDYLKNSGEECRSLGKEFLIGVTKFFRDQQAFEILQNEVIPDMIRQKEDGEILKIWVTACSTGEEAYSLAILVDECLQRADRNLEVKIFATDIDAEAIEYASRGIYPVQNLEDMEDRLIKKYFTRQGSQMQIQPRLRKQVVFARHNIIKDPPFIKNDMVTCRNMLIYMNNILQRKVLSTLQFSLNKGGFLFLGPSEIPSVVKGDFEEVNGKWKIFRKISNEKAYNPDRFPAAQNLRTYRDTRVGPSPRESMVSRELTDDFQSLLVKEFGFAALYVDNNYEIKEAIGNFRKYLSLPDRIMNLNVLKMVSHEVSIALNTALRKATKEGITVTLSHVRVKQEDKEKYLNLLVKPTTREGYIMIVISESTETVFRTQTPTELPVHSATESAGYIAELEDELKETRNNLQMAIESLETANEELQSSNEELLSANEELQSSNEELQSLNEELHTLNTEHQLRIKELIELNDDLNNYFRSTEIAQVFVDRELRIRKFNPGAVKMINLIDSDIGRPIEHLSTNFHDSFNLISEICTVINNSVSVEREIKLQNGSLHLMRILPYVRQDKSIDGVVITLVDITNLKELDNVVRGVFNASHNAIMVFKVIKNVGGEVIDFRFTASNNKSDELIGKPQVQYMDQPLSKVFPPLMKKNILADLKKVVETGEPYQNEVLIDKPNEQVWYDMAVTVMNEGMFVSLININEKKIAEEKFRRNYFELMKVKESYRNLSIELEEKVNQRTFDLSKSEERFRLIANATSDAIWDWDLVNNRIWWSDSFYNTFGYVRSEETENSSFWMQHIHEEDRESFQAMVFNAINNGEDTWNRRYRFRKANGEYAIILDKGTLLKDSGGTPFRMVGAMMDITEAEFTDLRLREKNDELQRLYDEFKFVTDFMPQMVWSTTAEGYHDFYNKGWFDYTGLDFGQSRDQGWSLVLHPDDYDRTLKVWNESLATGNNYEIEYRMKRHDGEYRWFLARAIPLRNDENEIVKWFGTCTDIHDQKLMSDILEQKVIERTLELQKINLELEASNNELLQFASVASHDLKEPLRKIHMFSNLIRDRYLLQSGSGALDYINRIISASARMTKLINDLLSFTRLSIASSFERVSLNTVVEEVLSDLELSIQETKARIDVGDLPEAEVVSGQIRQVFQNIVSNSLKFIKKGESPHITIESEIVQTCAIDARPKPGGNFCRIRICDNGIGFDNQYAEKIFTIFQRLHSREQYEGTGIGLAITRKIIEKHNGVIAAYNKEQGGACFVFVLPLRQNTEMDINRQVESLHN